MTGRVTPCEAIRAICADVSVGNRSAAPGALVSGVDRITSCSTLRALDCLWERNVDTPDFTFNGYTAGREGVLRQSADRSARAHIELRAVRWAGHRRAIECAFTH